LWVQVGVVGDARGERRRLEGGKTTKTTKGTKPLPLDADVHVSPGECGHGDSAHLTIGNGPPQCQVLPFVLFVSFVVLPLR